MGKAILTPEGQSATFIELFFDLVFVFGVTQLVGLLHHDLSWAGAGRSLLVFWMVWWAWTQFTWALNAANTNHPFVELGTLLATALAFFMAVSIPDAFGSGSLWFAITYVSVRLVGLTLYAVVALHHPSLRGAVRSFASLSVGGLACAIVGGYLGGTPQLWLWGLTIFLDFVAAVSAGDSEAWDLHVEHFAERHGLIVIIALGESLIVAAAGVVGTGFAGEILAVAVVAVLVTCALWWTYFPVAKPTMEKAVEAVDAERRSGMARDAYSFGHFPMLCGVVAYAVALEEALAHPTDALPATGRLAVALGLFLFLAGTAFGMWRTTGGVPWSRVLIAAATAAAVYGLAGVPPLLTLSTALAGIVTVAVLDEVRCKRLTAEAA